jgi:hypothetical protein
MSCQHETNEIDIFELPEEVEFVEESETGDEPLQDSQPMQIRSQPMQIGKRSKSPMHEDPDEESENAHSWSLHHGDQTAQRSAANAETIAHSRRSAAAIKKSSKVPTGCSCSSSFSSANRESCQKKSR